MSRTSVFAIAALAITVAPVAAAAQQDDHDHETNHAHGAPRHLDDDHHGGFPEFVDVFFTHHAYLEKKLNLQFVATSEEEAAEFEEVAELAWQFNRWFGGEIEVPFLQIDPDDEDGRSGIGDIEIAPVVSFYQNSESMTILSARSGFVLPTGDEEDGLGADGWTWEPGFLIWQGYGAEKRGAIQAELTYERLYVDEGGEEDEEEFVFNLSWSHWLRNNWIPIAELNVVSPIGEEDEHEDGDPQGSRLVPASSGGGGSEDTVVSTTLGFRYAFANGQQWGGGVQFPLSDTDAYDVRFIFGGIIHF